VHFWWGDERFVPLDHGESNAGLAMVLLFGVGRDQENASMTFPARAERIHPVPVDPAAMRHEGPDGAARRYADELERTIARRVDGVPAFDVVLLGVGPDGHILSVFPGSPALEPGAPLAMGIDAPQHVEPHVPRVTLSPRILDAATEVIVSVSGAGKTAIVGRVLRGERDPRALPAQLATGSNAVWLLDRESAAGLG
jgi:6-phosphogluconolactonase